MNYQHTWLDQIYQNERQLYAIKRECEYKDKYHSSDNMDETEYKETA